jgi:TRAP-type uncharacterized transport system substrate-binding protein
MKNTQLLIIAASCALLAACDGAKHELRFVTPADIVDRSIVEEFSTSLDDNGVVTLQLTSAAMSEEAALDAVASGDADLALVSNNLPFHSDIATVMPLYPTVLHIGRSAGSANLNGLEMLRGTTVFAGPEGSASRIVFERIAKRIYAGSEKFQYVDSLEDVPDVVIVFSALSPERVAEISALRLQFPEFEFATFGKPAEIGHGGIIDAAVLLNPQFRPFIIPVGTYGELPQEPIATVAVDKVLVARKDLDSAAVYDLINEILRLRPSMAARRPGLFQQLSEDFDTSRSTFIVHSGTQDYLQRSAPTVYERYSGVAEVVVTLIVALGSATIAGLRIFRMRRKNRIDTFYTQTIELRRSIDESTSPAERARVIADVRALQNTAFDLLVDEKLAADESFRIFITLSNDVLRQLGDNGVQLRASDG